jgi:tRNA-specific 2-thiouridylase
VDDTGREVGELDAVELVTVGQRRGLGLAGGDDARYVVGVDVAHRTVRVGSADQLLVSEVVLDQLVWAADPEAIGPGRPRPTPSRDSSSRVVDAQCSAHGAPRPATVEVGDGGRTATVRFVQPERRVAVGQSVVLYDGDEVLGGGIVAA